MIVIGYCHGADVAYCFHESLIRAIAELGPDVIGHIQGVAAGAMGLDRARNEICERFLETKAEWLLFIDADMQFKPQDIRKLLLSAHPTKRPVVGGLCFKLQGMNPEYGPVLVPTIFKDSAPVMDYSGMQRCDATGAAFLLIHRSVLRRMKTNWFSYHSSQEHISEDWAFCNRLGELGIPLYVNTEVKIGHQKSIILEERDFISLVERLKGTVTSAAP